MTLPSKALPGVKIKQFFPVTSSTDVTPAQAACLIGPMRTVVPGEAGILWGDYFGTYTPVVMPGSGSWSITSDVGASVNATDVTVRFADASVSFTGATYFHAGVVQNDSNITVLEAIVTAIQEAPIAASLIRGYRIKLDNPLTDWAATLTLLPSQFALDEGFLPSLIVTVNTGSGVASTTIAGVSIQTSAVTGAVAFSGAGTVAHDYPDLAANWSEIKTANLTPAIVFGIEEIPEKFTYDLTSRQKAAVTAFIGKSSAAQAFKRDFAVWRPDATGSAGTGTIAIDGTPGSTALTTSASGAVAVGDVIRTAAGVLVGVVRSGATTSWTLFENYVGTDIAAESFVKVSPSDSALSISFPPMEGTQRVTALSVSTGVEYDLIASSDAGHTAASADYSVSGAVIGSAYPDGANLVSINMAGNTLATLLDQDLIIRAVYIPEHVMSPLPVRKYAALRSGQSAVYEASRIDDFVAASSVVTALPVASKAAAARMTYSAVSSLFDFADPANEPIAVLDLRPTLALSFKHDFSDNVTLTLSTLANLPNPQGSASTDIVIKTASGAVVDTSTYTYNGTEINPGSGAILSAVNNPCTVYVNCKPDVEFVGDPELKFISAGSGRTDLTPVSLGGGFFRVTRPTAVAPDVAGDPYGAYSINATIEYPVEPEMNLEFVAERNDLDGTFVPFSSIADAAAYAAFNDSYAGQALAADTSFANPTLNALKAAISAQAGIAVYVGIGEMTALRSAPILQRLEREFDPYDIVPITQDYSSALTYIGAHIDKVVATFSGEQHHMNAGKFRVMYFTIDQRRELPVLPSTADTLASVNGKFENYSGGGIAFVANLTAYTSTLANIAVGDYIEFYQVNTAGADSVEGGSFFDKAVAHRFQIVSLDVSTPASSKFVVTDAVLPPELSLALKTYHIERGGAFRIVRVRSDNDVADGISAIAQGVKDRTRQARNPDFIDIELDGVESTVPGYYRSVVEASYRSSQLPHKGMTWRTIPLLTSVKRGTGYYSSDDTIHVMTDNGVDYAIQDRNGGPVYTLKQLTTDRTNQYTANPNVVRVMDFFALGLYNVVKPFIGKLNVNDAAVETLSAVVESFIARMKVETDKDLGGIIVDGTITNIEILDDTETNAGVAISVKIRPARQLEMIDINLYVDSTVAA